MWAELSAPKQGKALKDQALELFENKIVKICWAALKRGQKLFTELSGLFELDFYLFSYSTCWLHIRLQLSSKSQGRPCFSPMWTWARQEEPREARSSPEIKHSTAEQAWRRARSTKGRRVTESLGILLWSLQRVQPSRRLCARNIQRAVVSETPLSSGLVYTCQKHIWHWEHTGLALKCAPITISSFLIQCPVGTDCTQMHLGGSFLEGTRETVKTIHG